MASPRPCSINISTAKIEDIRRKVANFPWSTFKTPENSDNKPDWKYGPPSKYMSRLCGFWLDKYDWFKRQERMNSLPQFMAEIEEYQIHFVHERGSGTAGERPPILLLHGWPYSFHSFHEMVPRLAHPERFGGNLEDAVDVIVPSMPGYDFSSPPSRPIGPREICRIYHLLMTNILEYDK